MALPTGISNRINTVLEHAMGLRPPGQGIASAEAVMEASATIADAAYKSLYTGLNGAKVRELWGNTPSARLDQIKDLITPCEIPDVARGDYLCTCGRSTAWPCAVTKSAWLARGHDPVAQAERLRGEAFGEWAETTL